MKPKQMTLQSALHIIQREQAAIGNAAHFQNPAALQLESAAAMFSQKPDESTAARLKVAVMGWQEYCQQNPHTEV